MFRVEYVEVYRDVTFMALKRLKELSGYNHYFTVGLKKLNSDTE